MKRATIRFILDKRMPYEKGYSVKLKFTYLRKKTLFATRVFVQNEEELEIMKIYDKVPRLKRLKEDQKVLKAIWKKAEEVLEKLEKEDAVSHHNFSELIRNEEEEKVKDVFQYFQSHIDELKAANRIGTATSYQNSLDCLKRFHYRKRLSFDQITQVWLDKFEAWMLTLGRSETTVGIYLRALRTILNKAIEEKIIDREKYPFGKRRFTIPGGRNPKKALNLDEIKLFLSISLTEGSTEDRARDIFLFSLLCNGANMKDVMGLKWKNISGNTIEFIREKTKRTTKGARKAIEVVITLRVKELLDKWGTEEMDDDTYIFPFLNGTETEEQKLRKVKWHTTNINKALKKIANRAGIIKPISTVVARHTYATILKNSGAPMQFISESLGHSNTTTTQSYLDAFDKEQQNKYATGVENKIFNND